MRNLFKYIFAALAVMLPMSVALAQVTQENCDRYVNVEKTVTDNQNGTYTLKMQNYLTGKIDSEESRKPLNAVLVLDVSGSMGYYLNNSYVARESVGYTYSNAKYSVSNKDYHYYYKHTDGKYYEVVPESESTGNWLNKTTYYYLKVKGLEDNGVNYYLVGSGITTGKPTSNPINSSNGVIWTGVLYDHSRLGALKEAVNEFIDIVSADNTNHKLSIVTYASSASIKADLQNVGDGASLKSIVSGLIPNGGTQAGQAMSSAKGQVDKMTSANNSGATQITKLVIMFTDGVPSGSGSSFDDSTAGTAIHNSYIIKNAGAKVYSIGLFEGEQNTNVQNYMEYLSSNYPNANCTDSNQSCSFQNVVPGSKDSDKYCKRVADKEELKKVFENIGKENATGADITLDVKEVVLKDIVSSSFRLPEGANAESIRLYEIACASATREGVSTWDENNKIKTNAVAAIEGKTVSVTGFDFSDNWCGPEIKNGIVVDKHGRKLVIEFDIILEPDSQGGLLTTNTNDSGIYVGDKAFVQYKVNPSQIFASSVELRIKVNGLAAGESAMFKVTRTDKDGNAIQGDDFGVNVIVTQPSTLHNDLNYTAAEAKLKVDAYNGNYTNPYKYKVEKLDWSWAELTLVDEDENDNAIQAEGEGKVLYSYTTKPDGTLDTVTLDNKFIFSASLSDSFKNANTYNVGDKSYKLYDEDASKDNIFTAE